MATRPARPARPAPRARILLYVVLAAAAVGGLHRWAYLPNATPRNFGVVETGQIYRSAALTPAALRRLQREHGVRTVVDLGGFDKDPAGERVAAETAKALGMSRHVFPLEGDGTGNPNAYVAALRVLADPASHPVLVHCASGAQRTGACVVLYRHVVQGRPISEVYPEAFAHGHDPGDNWRLMAYLADYGERIDAAYRMRGWVEGFAPVQSPAPTAEAERAVERGDASPLPALTGAP